MALRARGPHVSTIHGEVELTLHPSRVRIMCFIALALVFVGPRLALALSGDAGMWVSLIFFGLCLLTFLYQLLTVSTTYLKIDKNGITYTLGRARRSYPWRCIVGFRAGRLPGTSFTKVVYFDVHLECAAVRGERFFKRITGHSSMLMNTYRVRAEQLAQLLNDRRSNALDRSRYATAAVTQPWA